MKAFSPGLSDSIASLVTDPRRCPHCDSSSHIAGGLCVGCLLEAGLDPADGCDSAELSGVLAEINLPDQNWRLGNYEILEEIGRGGMGVIYRARQRHSRRIVAVKRVLSYHADSHETLARFRREAQAAASLDHPNILPIYEVSESEDGLPFFSMKFAPGGTLQQVAPALRNDLRRCVAIVAKVARAVQSAHSRGILHRDLKPGNILLDGLGEPLVGDFGLAKWLDTTSDLTRTLTIFGTPGYIAPEQASQSAAELKPTADVYSLGAILFDLLAGRPPFLGAHALSVIRQAAESPAPKLRTLSKVADRDLETICTRCLEREPIARYHCAHDLAEDLERWLEGRPIIARPVAAPVRLWRWTRRNPLLACAAAVCVLVAAVAVARQAQSWRLEKEVAAQIAAQHSIEVSVFLDLDNIEPSENWTRNFTAELTNALHAFGPAVVRMGKDVISARNAVDPPTSSAAPTRAILCGTLRTLNGKRRISLHLLNAVTRELLAQRIIDADTSDDAASPARAIAATAYTLLSSVDLAKVTPATSDPGLRDPEARSFIDAGLELANRRGGIDFDRGIRCLQRAIELQPESAAAHAALGKILTMKSAYRSNREPLALAETAARKAVALAPASGESHLALAAVLYHQGKAEEAIQENLTALEYSPSAMRELNLLSNIYKTTGHPEKALASYGIALKNALKPGEGDAHIGDCLSYLLEDDRAEAAYQRYFQLHPEQPDGWMGLCRLRLLQGNAAEARSIYRRETKGYLDFAYSAQMAAQVEFFDRDFTEATKLYTQLYAQDPEGGGFFYAAVTYASALGRLKLKTEPSAGKELLARARQTELALLQEVPGQPFPLYRLASIEASLGAVDSAFEYLDAAATAGWIDYRSTALDPRFDSIRADPRFAKYLSRLAARVAELKRLRPVASAALQTAQ